MKNELVKIWSDPVYEASVRVDLEKAKVSLQKVVDTWAELDIGPITDLHALINNCEQEYSAAVNANVETPVFPGKYQVSKDVWIRTLNIPVPNQLYVACRECRKNSYCQKPVLWQIVDGKVEAIEIEVFYLADANSIYAKPDQMKFVEDVIKYVETTNAIAEKLELLMGRPCEHQFYLGKPFRITQLSYPGPFKLELVPSALKELLR